MTNESRQMKVEPDVLDRIKEVQKDISPDRRWSDYYAYSLSATVEYLLEIRDALIAQGADIRYRPDRIKEKIVIRLPEDDETTPSGGA